MAGVPLLLVVVAVVCVIAPDAALRRTVAPLPSATSVVASRRMWPPYSPASNTRSPVVARSSVRPSAVMVPSRASPWPARSVTVPATTLPPRVRWRSDTSVALASVAPSAAPTSPAMRSSSPACSSTVAAAWPVVCVPTTSADPSRLRVDAASSVTVLAATRVVSWAVPPDSRSPLRLISAPASMSSASTADTLPLSDTLVPASMTTLPPLIESRLPSPRPVSSV